MNALKGNDKAMRFVIDHHARRQQTEAGHGRQEATLSEADARILAELLGLETDALASSREHGKDADGSGNAPGTCDWDDDQDSDDGDGDEEQLR